MRTSFRRTAFVATAIISLSAVAAGAAPLAAGNGAVAAPPAMASSPARPHNTAGQVEQLIAGLHATLQITTTQQATWDRFAQVMRDNATEMAATFRHRAETLPGMTAPESMEFMPRLRRCMRRTRKSW